MKSKTITHKLKNNGEGHVIDVEIYYDDQQVDVAVVNGDEEICMVSLEYYDGQVKGYVWNEHDWGDDPTAVGVLIENPKGVNDAKTDAS